MKALGYERYSSLSQSEASIVVQKEAIEKYCEDNSITLVKHYSDYAISGRDALHRPEFLKMIDEISTGEYQFVIVYTRDRFSRSMKDFVKYLQIMSEYNCNLRCVNGDSEYETATSKLSSWILMSLSEYYSDNLKREVIRGLRYNAEHGIWNNKPPFGYDRNKETGKLVINETEAKAVRRIITLYANGYKTMTIMKMLYDEGYRRKDGSEIKTGLIWHILESRAYIGEYKYCIKSTNDVYVIPNGVPAIIDTELYNKALETIKRNKRSKLKSNLDVGIIDKKLRCGYSNRKLTRSLAKYDTKYDIKYEYFCCSSNIRGMRHCSEIPVRLLEDIVYLITGKILLGERNRKKVIDYFNMYFDIIRTNYIKINTDLVAEKEKKDIELKEILNVITGLGQDKLDTAIERLRNIQNEINSIESLIAINEPKIKSFNLYTDAIDNNLNELQEQMEYSKDKVISKLVDSIIVFDDFIMIKYDASVIIPFLSDINLKNLFVVDIKRAEMDSIIHKILHKELDFSNFNFRRGLE